MFGLHKRSSKEKSQQQAIFQYSSHNLLNTVQDRPTLTEGAERNLNHLELKLNKGGFSVSLKSESFVTTLWRE